MSDRKNKSKKKQNNKDIYMEEEPDLFSELIDEIEDISDHMVHLKDNHFYYLLSKSNHVITF